MQTVAKKVAGQSRKPVAAPANSGSKELTQQEVDGRRVAVETARGLLAIEGLACSNEVEVDGKAWVNGELTTEEVRARIYSRAGLPVPSAAASE